jgi:hypothetical protein
MKYLIFAVFMTLLFTSCEKPPLKSINTTNSVSIDSIIPWIKSGYYTRYSETIGRPCTGLIKMAPNSLTIDSSHTDSIFCYIELCVSMNYQVCENQLQAEKTTDPSIQIAHVDTPTHVILNSLTCPISYFGGLVHTQYFIHFPQPVMRVQFIGTTGDVQNTNNAIMEIGRESKIKILNGWPSMTISQWCNHQLNNLSNKLYSRTFTISSINSNQRRYSYVTGWNHQF